MASDSELPYAHETVGCFADRIGDGGLTDHQVGPLYAQTTEAVAALRHARDEGTLPLLALPGRRDDLAAPEDVAKRYRQAFDDVVILGTGGSSLGGQTLYALADRGFGPPAGAPRIHFMDNVDPDTFSALLTALDPARTGIVAISKSGSTAETMTQLLVCLDALRRAGRPLADHVTMITEPADNVMRRLAGAHGIAALDHDPGIGGRYSALSLVGLLPAMIAGLNVGALRDGAAQVLDGTLGAADPATMPPCAGAAISVALNRHHGVSQTVLMPYVDRLAVFGLWFRQLWAESLGKDGEGTTPVRAVGTVDQHSQLQLYLGGPRDKMYSVMLLETVGKGPAVPPDLAADPSLGYLAGRTMGDLIDAEGRATAETLMRNGRPTRLFRLPVLDERAMGALMMHFMLETIVAAHLLEVDPFDQPAVEEGKVLTRDYLAQSGGAGRS